MTEPSAPIHSDTGGPGEDWECCGETDCYGFCPDGCPHIPREPYRPELFTGPVKRVRHD